MKMIPDQRLGRMNAAEPRGSSVPVLLHANMLATPLLLPKSKPDLAFGYPPAAFAEKHLMAIDLLVDDQFGRSYAVEYQKIRFPFLSVDFKSQAKNGTHYVATSQAAGAGAVSLSGNLKLIQRSLRVKNFDYEEPRFSSVTSTLVKSSCRGRTTLDGFEDLGLIERCSDGWVRAIFSPYGKCPQPDSTIAFKWEKFSREEVRKLGITIGLPSKYMARDDMFFPFITREAKCDKQPLEIADRQNVYSMSVALEGVVDLFRRVDRLEELDGKALGLSVSYDNDTVKMYAHHVVTTAQEASAQGLSGQSCEQLRKMSTMKYRTRIGLVSLSDEGGKGRWKPYDFFYNACLKFSRRHLTRIKQAIALLPVAAQASSQSVPCVDEIGQELQAGEGVFKKPRNGGVNGELRKQLAGLERQLEEQKR
ncbi:hypothetical protein RBB50_011450 [Rhinocladiella similis]